MKSILKTFPYKDAPLTMRDILMERVEFEDRLMHKDDPILTYPPHVLRKERPSSRKEWSGVGGFVFGRQIIKFSLSMLP